MNGGPRPFAIRRWVGCRGRARIGRVRLAALTLVLASGGLALWAPAASATFHLMLVREVYPGLAANPGSEYVELQMYTAGQNLVAGHVVRTYGAGGAVTGVNAFGSDVANGANQSTIVMATPAAEAQFGIVADGALSPAGQLDPAGGAACWENLDCVSWGAFSGSLPSPAGQPAAPAGIPDGMALRRTIAPNCPTLLEAADDSNGSALDFSAVFPSPRFNSVPPSEHACSSQPPPGGGYPPGGSGAPRTRITGHPRKVTRDRTPTFRFASNRAGASFLCKLDRRRFRPCRSPFTTRRLSPGRHLFAVKARAPSGTLDPTPARYRFRVV
jgi:hypothetical protein